MIESRDRTIQQRHTLSKTWLSGDVNAWWNRNIKTPNRNTWSKHVIETRDRTTWPKHVIETRDRKTWSKRVIETNVLGYRTGSVVCIHQNLITNYIFKRPIIYSRGRLYIQEADYIFLMALSHWSIHTLKSKLLLKKIKVKTSGLVNAKHLITYSWSWRHSDSTVFNRNCECRVEMEKIKENREMIGEWELYLKEKNFI